MEIIDSIIKQNQSLFGNNPSIEKINIGFTNEIYNINDKYIIKVCTNINNEEDFKKEIRFYEFNKDNELIPKLFYSSTDKTNIPYYYEILEKISGVSLYSVWYTYSEEQREDVIKQLCNIMKIFHSVKGDKYSWLDYIKNKYNNLIDKAKDLFNEEEKILLNRAYLEFDKYLDCNEFVLVHNDLHFDNIFVENGKIKVIDFERSMYAPRDFELDIIYRMIRKPWKFASEETEKYVDIKDYSNIMNYIDKYYHELFEIDNLYIRLAIYDIVYFLEQLLEYPHLKELKDDILSAVDIVIKN